MTRNLKLSALMKYGMQTIKHLIRSQNDHKLMMSFYLSLIPGVSYNFFGRNSLCSLF